MIFVLIMFIRSDRSSSCCCCFCFFFFFVFCFFFVLFCFVFLFLFFFVVVVVVVVVFIPGNQSATFYGMDYILYDFSVLEQKYFGKIVHTHLGF